MAMVIATTFDASAYKHIWCGRATSVRNARKGEIPEYEENGQENSVYWIRSYALFTRVARKGKQLKKKVFNIGDTVLVESDADQTPIIAVITGMSELVGPTEHEKSDMIVDVHQFWSPEPGEKYDLEHYHVCQQRFLLFRLVHLCFCRMRSTNYWRVIFL